jgi:hypothetical protein
MGYYPEDGLEGLESTEDQQQAEDECYYGCDFCQDNFLRDNCGCIGCDVQDIPDDAKTPPTCPHCDQPMTLEDEQLNGEPTYSCNKCNKIHKCTRDYIEKLWEDLCGPKPLGLIDSVNENNAVLIQSTEEQKEPTK